LHITLIIQKPPAEWDNLTVISNGFLEFGSQKCILCVFCSESGEWQWDDSPRLIPWNVAGDPFVNQCDNRHLQIPGNVAFQKADDIARHGGNWTVSSSSESNDPAPHVLHK